MTGVRRFLESIATEEKIEGQAQDECHLSPALERKCATVSALELTDRWLRKTGALTEVDLAKAPTLPSIANLRPLASEDRSEAARGLHLDRPASLAGHIASSITRTT
jgi:hypothetical protein